MRKLPGIEDPGHEPSVLGAADHRVRVMNRRAAGFIGPAWDDAACAAVAPVRLGA